MKVGITSVLIMKENILFLEEWIDYHLNLGFDHIFLYDNSKVQKKCDFDISNKILLPQKVNKYGSTSSPTRPQSCKTLERIFN